MRSLYKVCVDLGTSICPHAILYRARRKVACSRSQSGLAASVWIALLAAKGCQRLKTAQELANFERRLNEIKTFRDFYNTSDTILRIQYFGPDREATDPAQSCRAGGGFRSGGCIARFIEIVYTFLFVDIP
jgi:hypothetical protein